MAINTKDLHKICGKLREDRFLAVYVSHAPLWLPAAYLALVACRLN